MNTYTNTYTMLDYYGLLDLPRSRLAISDDDLKKAYKKACLRHHPDKGGDAETFKELAVAYETLGNESKKRAYDAVLFMA